MKKLFITVMISLFLWGCTVTKTVEVSPTPTPDPIAVQPPTFIPQTIEMPLEFQLPMKDPIVTSRFGYRNDLKKGPMGGGDSIHMGLDMIPKNRKLIHAPILAAADGEVVIVYPPPSKKFKGHVVFGGCIQIKSDSGWRTKSGKIIWAYTLYGHMSDVWMTEGTMVKAGQVIGLMGNTGQAEGYHLHFEVSFDPEDFLPELDALPTLRKAQD